jgi:hypothetical protein
MHTSHQDIIIRKDKKIIKKKSFFYAIFTFLNPQILHKDIFFNFHMDFIQNLLYWKFVMKGVVHLYYVWFMFELDQ